MGIEFPAEGDGDDDERAPRAFIIAQALPDR